MVFYMEKGKPYFVDIAFWDPYEVGSIYYDIEYIGASYDHFRLCSHGYFTYDTLSNTLLATFSDSNNTETGYTQGNLFVIDDYVGEWICDDEAFANVEFSFNGDGLYGFLYGYAGMEGSLTLHDLTTNKRTVLSYSLDSTLKGHFAYNGILYVMEYDEDAKAVRLTANGTVSNLQAQKRES